MSSIRNFGRKSVVVFRNGVKIGTYELLKSAALANGLPYSKASECANGKRILRRGFKVCFV